jgi:hypothetical protein
VVSSLAGDYADMVTDQLLDVNGGLMTGYEEDLRAIRRQTMIEMKTVHEDKK